jgi:Ca2+-binding RTX toxin-like protein
MSTTFTPLTSTADITAAFIQSQLVGPGTGVTINSVSYTGVIDGISTFSTLNYGGGISLDKGILLTSGSNTPEASNTESSFSTNNEGPNSTTLDAVAATAFSGAGTTNDASLLTITFTADAGVNSIRLSTIFGSDEYPEFSDTIFVDVAAVIVNGVNYGLFNNNTGQPLSVISSNIASGGFINNTANTLTIEYDGVSPVLNILAPVVTGLNTIVIGVADTGDFIYDSGLAISSLQGSSFNATNANGVLVQVKDVTDGNDNLDGGDANEEFDLGFGDDFVEAGKGADLFFGDEGNDTVFGGEGDDSGQGGQGDDAIYGNQGDDVVYGNTGDDDVYGGKDEDTVYGGQNNDVVYGNFQADLVYGNFGADTLFGGQDNDLMFGGKDNDLLLGNSGDDTMFGNAGNDTLIGGAGNDLFVGATNGGNDIINDFTTGDKIQVLGINATTLLANIDTNGNGDAVITFTGGSITLIGVDEGSVNSSFFI